MRGTPAKPALGCAVGVKLQLYNKFKICVSFAVRAPVLRPLRRRYRLPAHGNASDSYLTYCLLASGRLMEEMELAVNNNKHRRDLASALPGVARVPGDIERSSIICYTCEASSGGYGQ